MKRALVVVLGALALATSSPLVAAQESSTAPAEVSMPAAPAPADVRAEASGPANMAAPAGSGESGAAAAAAAAAPTGESGSGVITGVPAGAHSVEVPKSENSGKIAGALSAAEASAAASDGRTVQRAASGRVTIVDNSNRLNMVAEKPQYDEVTAARIAQDRLKMDMEEHQKKLDALAREELAEQNGKSEESNKLNAQKMKQQHESTTSAEEKSKVAHEELQKKTAKDNAAEADAKRDAQEKAMAAGQREAIEEASAKSAAHAKQKAALADGSWQKDSNGNVVNADKAVGLAQFNNYGGGWAQAVSRVVGQVCVVSGLVRGPGGGHVGTLDASCRPGGGRLIFNQMVGGSDSRVDVLADGRVYHIVAGNPPDYLSLAGVTFDTNPGASLTLYNGWNNYGSGYRPRSLARLGSHCIASGLISSGPWGLIGAVSSDCVPNERLIFSSNNHASVTRTDIVNNGQIYYAGGSANYGWVSLDGMIYSPGNGGTDISLAWPWTNYGGGYRGARYSVSSGVCAVSGLIRTQAGWSSRLFTLPAECRPKGNIIFATNAHDRSVRVDVHPDGTVDFVGNTGSYGWISLSNIHFVVA